MTLAVYLDMPEEDYFGNDALSASDLKMLLPPSCPARFQHAKASGQVNKPHFDKGKAAHGLVLGTGAEIAELHYNDWRTKAVKEERAAAYAKGQVPLLSKDVRIVEYMAETLAKHPIAGRLLAPGSGKAEISLFWEDDATKLNRRARLDWLRPDSIVDYKTCAFADLLSVQKAAFKYNYHQASASYEDAVRALSMHTADIPYYLVWQEKTAPFIVTVSELDSAVINEGRRVNMQAMQLYQQCERTGNWPGYTSQIETLYLPDSYSDWIGLDDDSEEETW